MKMHSDKKQPRVDREAGAIQTLLAKGVFSSLLLRKLTLWLRRKRLNYERRSSMNFQSFCEKKGFSRLAELEQAHRETIEREIQNLRSRD